MTSPFQKLAQKEFSESPEPGKKNPYKSPFEQIADSPKYQESTAKSFFRTVAQIPQGLLEATTPGLAASLWQLLSMGEVLDPLEIENIKEASERAGIPFDEEKYLEAAQQALGTIPTVSNIAGAIEERTGIPLEAKTRLQKGLRLGSMATKLAPQPGTFRGLDIGLPAPVLGAGVGATSQLSQELGVPEQIADIASFGILKGLPPGSAAISVGTKTKPSGLTERGFERLKAPREVSESKMEKINEKLTTDFKTLSEDIIKESPIGETAENLKNDPTYKQASRELLDEAQTIADEMPGDISSSMLKKELADLAANRPKGISLSEYEREYLKFMGQFIDEIIPDRLRPGDKVRQYRKNNGSLGEYFEPGASKALNRAKRDALLDYNRAIANVMEKAYPESRLNPVFKSGNARWTKIMDVEAVDKFIGEVFKEGINYKKLHDWFDKTGYDRIFKRALGEEGFKNFETLMKDMLTTEVPYKMLKVAKDKGLVDYVKLATGYLLKPVIGQTKLVHDVGKATYKKLINSMLDKPKLAFTWKKAVEDLKKGDFKASEKGFKTLEGEVQAEPKKAKTETLKPEETIEVEPIPTTAKGKAVKAFDQYGLTPFIEDAVNNGFINKFEDIEPYIRNNPTLLRKAERIQEDLGKSLSEIINDIYGKEKIKPAAEPIKEKPKRLETPKKQIEFKEPEKIVEKPKEIEIKTIKEKERSPFSHIKEATDKSGNFLGELSYDIEGGEIYISHIHVDESTRRQGIAKKLFKNLLEEHPEKEIIISPLQPDGAKFFSNMIDRKLKPQLTEEYEKIKGIPQEPIKLSEKDIKNAKERLGIKEKLKPETKFKETVKKIVKEKKEKISDKLPKPVKGEFEISLTEGGKEKKSGEIFDNLFAISKEKYGYTLHHVPTGVRILTYKNKKPTINFLHDLYENKLFDKYKVRTSDPEKLQDAFNIEEVKKLRDKYQG